MTKDCARASRLSPRRATPVITAVARARLTVRSPAAPGRLNLGGRSQRSFHEILKAENGAGGGVDPLWTRSARRRQGPGFEVQEALLRLCRTHIWECLKPPGGPFTPRHAFRRHRLQLDTKRASRNRRGIFRYPSFQSCNTINVRGTSNCTASPRRPSAIRAFQRTR